MRESGWRCTSRAGPRFAITSRASTTAARQGLAPTADTTAPSTTSSRERVLVLPPLGLLFDGEVVDHELRVHEVANVRVADASVMPTELTGNLNAPAIMIGERVADFIRGRVPTAEVAYAGR